MLGGSLLRVLLAKSLLSSRSLAAPPHMGKRPPVPTFSMLPPLLGCGNTELCRAASRRLLEQTAPCWLCQASASAAPCWRHRHQLGRAFRLPSR